MNQFTITTKFKAGDRVFPIYEDTINNDYYCTDTCWRIKSSQPVVYNTDQVLPSEIITIEASLSDTKTTICYRTDSYIFRENDVFATLKEAEAECRKREQNNI